MDSEKIISDFLNVIKDEITQRSIMAGQRVTGETLDSLEVMASDLKGTLSGNAYIMVLEDGRGPTKKGNSGGPKLKDIILDWMDNRGIDTIENQSKRKGIAYAIARNIHENGNALFQAGGHSGVISGVITDQRITAFVEAFGVITYNNFKDQVFEIFKNLENVTKRN